MGAARPHRAHAAFLRAAARRTSFFADVEAEAQAVADDTRARTDALGTIPTDVIFDHVY